jgi:hypothetical protein
MMRTAPVSSMARAVTGARLRRPQVQRRLLAVVLQPMTSVFRFWMIWCTSSTTPAHRLVLVHHAVHPERPHGRAAQRRQQDATNRVTQRLTEAPLQRRHHELRLAPVLRAVHDLDALR